MPKIYTGLTGRRWRTLSFRRKRLSAAFTGNCPKCGTHAANIVHFTARTEPGPIDVKPCGNCGAPVDLWRR